MAIIKIYGGIQFPESKLDPTPSHVLKNPSMDESGATSSSQNPSDKLSAAEVKSKRESLCNFNEPPVKSRPTFRKYGVDDFRYPLIYHSFS